MLGWARPDVCSPVTVGQGCRTKTPIGIETVGLDSIYSGFVNGVSSPAVGREDYILNSNDTVDGGPSPEAQRNSQGRAIECITQQFSLVSSVRQDEMATAYSQEVTHT